MNTGTATRLEVRDLVKRYGADRAGRGVARRRSRTVRGRARPVGLGKSTLPRSVRGIERVHGGRILLGDRLVADETLHVPPERRDLAMVFQDYALWPHLTVADNVAYPLRRKKIDRREAEKQATAVLERVGLSDYAMRFPSELSGGERQRVALGRALVGRPLLLLFDEPLSNLDADLGKRMRVEIATLPRESGATVVYITRDQSEAFALDDQIGVLDHGKLVHYARPETVYLRPGERFRRSVHRARRRSGGHGRAGRRRVRRARHGRAACPPVPSATCAPVTARGYDHVARPRAASSPQCSTNVPGPAAPKSAPYRAGCCRKLTSSRAGRGWGRRRR